MLTKYIDGAMKKARYEITEDGEFYGEIPGFQGVFGAGDSLTACQEQLRSVLEGWLILKLWDRDDDIPIVDKISLSPSTRFRKYAATQSSRNRQAS
jgi:predicted RNase H-like HicB family nuclease